MVAQLAPNGLNFVQPGDLETIAAPTDFFGLNYYSRSVMRADVPENEPQTVFQASKDPEHWTEMNWENYPPGLTSILGRVCFNYQPRKIYITENGAGYSTPPDAAGRVADTHRINYLKTHFAAAQRAIQAGVPLAGYFVWSLLDNFEWAKGYSQRFGLIWVDYPTQQRILKDSALWYARVIAQNAVESE
jgi:beta-glucosidase